MTNETYSFTRAATQRRIERILELLAEPMTAAELAAALPAAKRTVTSYLAYLRGMSEHGNPGGPRRVRIAGWRRAENGIAIALFQVGTKRDARRPAGRDVVQRRRDQRERLRVTDPDELRRRREARQEKRRKPRRDAITAALFGATP